MGSRVGSLYTATSLLFLAPVASRVLLGLISMLWMPHSWCTWAGGRLFSLLSRLGIWYGGFRVFTSSTISLLHLVPNMTCLWLSHWLQNTLFMLGSEVGRMFWNLLSVPRSLFMMQSTKLQEML